MATVRERETEASTSRFGRLRGNAIGGLGAAAIAMAFMGPATSVFFNTYPGATKTGYALPLGILLALVACLIIAATISSFSRKLPSTGFAYTYTTHAFGRGGGFVTGWLLAGAYAVVGPMLFAAFGRFGADFLQSEFDLSVRWWIVSIAIMLVVWLIGVAGINRSAETALVFLVLEVVVLVALFGTILVKGGHGGLSLAPFNPGESATGISGLGYGMLWGVLMFVGFESAGTLAEETRDPRRAIPTALFSSVLIIGLFYVLSGYAGAIGFGSDRVAELRNDTAPWSTLTNEYWSSSVAWLIALTVLNSQFANALSGSNAAVRMLFALGREGLVPRGLGRTDAGTPRVAWTAYIAISALITFLLAWNMGPLGVYGFLGTVLGLGIVLTYIAMNIALIWYFRTRHRDEFSLVRHGLLPAAGSLLMLLPIYGLLWPIPDYPLKLVPYVVVAWIGFGVVYFAYLRQRSPELVERMGRAWEAPSETP
jgi:amino acid transporter